METQIDHTVCTPAEGNVFPGTWPDCQDCHGTGRLSKDQPDVPCPTCQQRSAETCHSLDSWIEFNYPGRPENYVPAFPYPGEVYPPAWIPITWAELWNGTGVNAGTWPDCSKCRGIGIKRYDVGWDGHRSDYEWQSCRHCQHRTRQFHAEHPDEKDVLMRGHAAERKAMQERHRAEAAKLQTRQQAELDALPF